MKKLIYILIFLAFAGIANAQWQSDVRLTNDPALSVLSVPVVWSIAANGNTIHVVWDDTRNGNEEIYYKRSTDSGITWGTDTRLTNTAGISGASSIAVSGSIVHIALKDERDGNFEIYYKRSTDEGVTWGTDIRLTNASGISETPCIAKSGQVVCIAWSDFRDGNFEIYYKCSTDGGITWGADTRLTNNTGNSVFPSVAISGTTVNVVWRDDRDGNNEIYYKLSADGGATWGADTRLTNASGISETPCIAKSGQVVHVVWYDTRDGNQEIYYKHSTDGGATWGADTRLTNASGNSNAPNITSSGQSVHVVWRDDRDGNDEIYYKLSTDGGATWGADTRLTNAAGISFFSSIVVSGTFLHVVWNDNRDGNNEIYYKRNPTGNPTVGGWVQKSIGLPPNVQVVSFILNGTNLFAGTWGNGVYLSTDYGENWISYSNGLPIYIYNFAVNGNNLFVGTALYGVYKSTNNGLNWTQVNSGLTDSQILNLAVKGNDLYAGTYDNGIFHSTNNGNNWSNCLNISRIYGLYVMGNNIFAGTHYNGVFRSTNDGLNWVPINNGINYPIFYGFTSFENNLFAGTRNGGIFLTTNNGDVWNSVNNGLIYNGDVKVVSKDSTLFAGLSSAGGGMFISTNKGGNWGAMNQGFDTIPGVGMLSVINNYIFAGTTRGVWRRELTESIGIQNISTEIPSSFSLSQNYPNPFNPTTNIRFDVQKTGFISIKIYDILGREISILVNEQLKPGTYQVDWDGTNYTSGVYFYKLYTESYTETKKMLMIK